MNVARVRPPWVIGMVVAALVCTSCGSDDSGAATLDVPRVFDLELDPGAAVPAVDPARTNVLTAEQLQSVLEAQLAWHGITLVKVMQTARASSADSAPWIAQLVQNTADLTGSIGLVYGRDAARAFNQQWGQHTQFLTDYAVAIGAGDAHAAAAAKANLVSYTIDSGSFFETATAGGLRASAVTDLLATHVAHMLAMLDADQAGDAATSVGAAVTDSAYLSTIADALAGAIATQQPLVFTGSTTTAHAAYCTIVTTQASTVLVADVMRGDTRSAAAMDALSKLGEATGVSAKESLGLPDEWLTADADVVADTAKAALDHAVAFAAAH